MKKYILFCQDYNGETFVVSIQKVPWWKRLFKKKKLDIKVL